MKLKTLIAGITFMSLTTGAMAAEPTRGFLLEKGATAALGKASADASIGHDDLALRLGLGDAELLLARYNVGTTDSIGAIAKYSLKQVDGLAVYVGLSQYDSEGEDWDENYVNIKAGAAFTATVEQFELTANAELVFDDRSGENYFNIGAGAFMNLAKTTYGTFKPGIEVVASTYDEQDTRVVVGLRWEYSNRLTIDAMPFDFGGQDVIALPGAPGAVRVNFAF